MKLEGVTLNVRDLDRAKDFYAKLPGAALIRDEPEIASFSFGEARVSLKKSDEEGFHLEMAESDLDSVRSASEVAEDQGDKIFVEDPDGHRIEVEQSDDEGGSHGQIVFNPARDEENAGLG